MRKQKSVFFILLAFVLGIGCFFGARHKHAYAEQTIKSKSAYLIDYRTQTELYKCNEEEKLPIASMCKIMTLNLCFDAIERGDISLDDKVVVSNNASGMGGSQIFLECNAEYSVEQLIKGIVVASANDACVAMAERLYGSEEAFVEKMNEKAIELGMTNTVFVNCTGLPKSGQFSTASDVAKMFCELLNHKDYYAFSRIWIDEINHPNDRVTQISNTNKLIRFYNGCDGGKTGYTSEAGHCVCASAERNGLRLVSVIIKAPDSKTRFKEASELFNYGFSNYQTKTVIDNSLPLDLTINIENGKQQSLPIIAEKSFYILTKKGEKTALEVDFEPIDIVKAPINKGEIVGKLVVYKDAIEIGSINVLANCSVAKKSYLNRIKDVIDNWALA